MITLAVDFHLVILSKCFICDHIKLLITSTNDCIKRLTLQSINLYFKSLICFIELTLPGILYVYRGPLRRRQCSQTSSRTSTHTGNDSIEKITIVNIYKVHLGSNFVNNLLLM